MNDEDEKADKLLSEWPYSCSATVAPNSGIAVKVWTGSYIYIQGTTIADVVVLNAYNCRERFDQARTKTNQNTIYVSAGDHLYSKCNKVMMSIVEDTFDGNHDLQKGMCSRSRHELAYYQNTLRESYLDDFGWEHLPSHGCWENLTKALAPYGVEAHDVPSPLNLFQHMEIDAVTGYMTNTAYRPKPPGAYVVLRAEVDCIVAVSACPDLTVGGKELYVRW